MMWAGAMALWMLAMIAGLCWARWVVGMLATASVLLACVFHPAMLVEPAGWFGVMVIGITPWLLASGRSRYERRLRRLQERESVKLGQLQEQTQELLQLQRENEAREGAITQITNLYHVTKATARALHVQELFAFSLELLPRLLEVKGLRLIDLMHQVDDSPLILRAHRVPDGRLLPDEASAALPIEQAVIQQVTRARTASTSEATTLDGPWPPGVAHLAWAPLWSEQKPIGVVIADELPKDQTDTLSIVANQLSLQLTRVHLYEAIESMAITDTLTGLLVRRYFLELAAEELKRSTRHGLPCALIMTDLDFFKMKNDTYGHLVGDVVLRDVAQLMHKNLRGIDLIARYGGEEFVLLLVETGPEQTSLIAERLRQMVELSPIRAYDETLTQTISMGVACFPEDGQKLPELIARADEALYAAKHGGRNRVVRWSKRGDQRPETRDQSLGSS